MPGSGVGVPGLMAGYLLKTTVVLLVALLAAAAAKRRPAAVRHFILTSALIGLVLLPLLALAPLGWRSPLLPAWMAVPSIHPSGAPKADRSGLASKAPEWLQVKGPEAGAGPAAGRANRWTAIIPASPAGLPNGERAPSPPPLSATVAPQGRPALPGLLLAVLWSSGLAVLLLRLVFGLAGAARLTAEGTPLDDDAWRLLLERFIAFVSLRRNVRLKSHPEVVVPLTWGFRRPIVLFPDGADAWTDDERSSALYHELSHIKRADFLAMLLVRTSLALFWWNPVCWIVYREILKEQEIACDELVLRAGIRPSTYAASLLAFRRDAGFRWSPSAALLGIVGRSSFEGRLAAILKQKLTSMEVKMKTKIMLALALVLAVALIGTARPAAGVAKSAVTTTVVETAVPAPASPGLTAPELGQTKAGEAVASEQEQEKAKAAEKAAKAEKDKSAIGRKIVVVSPEGGKSPIEITITEGDAVRTIVLEKSVTITKGKDGKVLVLTPEGKEPIVLEGEPLRLKIKGGELEVLKEGQTVKIGDGRVFSVVKKGGEEGGAVVFIGTTEPETVVEKIRIAEKEAGEAAPQVFVKMQKDMKEGEKWVAAPERSVEVVKVAPAKTKEGAWVVEGPERRPLAWTIAADADMLNKVRALQEQLQAIKAKKMDLSALEDSLKKLEAELQAKEEKLKELKIKLDKAPAGFTVVGRATGEEAEGKVAYRVVEKGKTARTEKARVFIASDEKGEGTINLIFTDQAGETGQAAFERVVTKLKQALPEGYKMADQKYDPESGAMTFKIVPPEGGKTDAELIEKLVRAGQEAIKAGK